MVTVAKKKKLHVLQPFIGYLFKNDFSFIFDIIYGWKAQLFFYSKQKNTFIHL